ncbi:MAG: hypothetical protein IJL62_02005 [Clostridia bacterium]|nr:hypothetical protein [Clostridia bacterium]
MVFSTFQLVTRRRFEKLEESTAKRDVELSRQNGRMHREINALKAEVAKLRTEIEHLNARLDGVVPEWKAPEEPPAKATKLQDKPSARAPKTEEPATLCTVLAHAAKFQTDDGMIRCLERDKIALTEAERAQIEVILKLPENEIRAAIDRIIHA